MATRQNSTNGKKKSPRIQVVLPEDLCSRLTFLAEKESRTISNMAKVLLQEGVNRYQQENQGISKSIDLVENTEDFRSALEAQEPTRLKGAPGRFKLYRPSPR